MCREEGATRGGWACVQVLERGGGWWERDERVFRKRDSKRRGRASAHRAPRGGGRARADPRADAVPADAGRDRSGLDGPCPRGQAGIEGRCCRNWQQARAKGAVWCVFRLPPPSSFDFERKRRVIARMGGAFEAARGPGMVRGALKGPDARRRGQGHGAGGARGPVFSARLVSREREEGGGGRREGVLLLLLPSLSPPLSRPPGAAWGRPYRAGTPGEGRWGL